MKALILAAGLGTRLRPVTNSIPKALVVAEGKPLLQHALEHIKRYGIRDVIINVHHFAAQIRDFLKANDDFGLSVTISDESDELLETGGGLKKASWFFSDGKPFLVRNVDILSDLDIWQMAEIHKLENPLATLAVRNRLTSRYFLFNKQNRLCGWENHKTGEKRMSREGEDTTPFAFSGIQILQPEIFSWITETGRFSLTDLYLRLATDHLIKGYIDNGLVWRDIGKKTDRSIISNQ
ncbi:MAG: nucleotidyltransferase family protein [Bacteroidales bacterium]|nr:nucleotidyltransferase family protein [Bacteroidales bacterium]